MSDQNDKLDQLKTSAFDRRFSLAKASFLAGTRWAAANASSLFSSEAEKERKRKQAMIDQANYLVDEIGKLKGSVVKIGQMMALYGEHFLPEEVTQALNKLNDNTTALAWPVIEQQLKQQLGHKFDELDIEHEPLGTASLAQVHRARRKSDQLELVVKVQYQGVADAIDSDMKLFRSMVKLTNLVPQTKEFDEWYDEVQAMLHREVDYVMEAATIKRFHQRLQHDPRYVVPQVIDEYCTSQILCMTFEHGINIHHPDILALPQQRRDTLGEAALEISIREIFEWGEMQTDPNFGNYLIRLSQDHQNTTDQIVLLDFGAIRQFDQHLLKLAQNLIYAGYQHHLQQMINAMTGYAFFDKIPASVKPDMAKLFLIAAEAFSCPANNPDMPTGLMDENYRYDWRKSQLHQRISQHARQSMASRYFSVPPKELMFISRKFIGAYTFMTVINAHTNARKMIENFIPSKDTP